MYTGVLDQKCIRNFFRSILYPIGPPSKLYEENQAIIKIVLADIIVTHVRPIDVLITDIHEHHLRKTFEMVDTRSNMQLSDLNSKTHGRKSLRDILDRVIQLRFCTPPGS